MRICIGSTNPRKTEAVELAVAAQWPDAHLETYEVESGVSSQPMSDEETRTGAKNRAAAALRRGLEVSPIQDPDAGIGIGLEGGVTIVDGHLWSTVWVAVATSSGEFFVANGARFPLPEKIAQLIHDGKELGPALAEYVQIENIRQKQGMIGLLTKNVVTRAEEYSHIARLALGLWHGRDWDHI